MLSLLSPAKINVFLKVVRKRDDGYHDIVSLFQTISLADTLTIEESEQDQFTCSNPEIPLTNENTVIKALALFRTKLQISKYFKIHIEKKIPKGAGLGGGSSNAATALFGLNQLLKNPLSTNDLQSIGKEIGSDVPFFLSEGSALCSGRGEVIEPLKPLLSGNLYVVMPGIELSTKDVYEALDSNFLTKCRFPKNASECSKENLEYFNDLEVPAFKLCPTLKRLKQDLSKSQKGPVFMTGSGSAFILLSDVFHDIFPDCEIFPAHFITRKHDSWYSCFSII